MKKGITTGCIVAVTLVCVLVLSGCPARDNENVDNEAMATIEFEKGLELATNGDYKQGQIHFEEALKYDNEHPRAWCGLGSVNREQQKYDAAIEYSLKAIELKPDYVVCHDNLGLAYAYKEEYEKSIASFKKAIELDAGYADAHFNLGSLYYKIGDDEGALKSYKQFITLSSKQKKIEEAKAVIEEIEKDGE